MVDWIIDTEHIDENNDNNDNNDNKINYENVQFDIDDDYQMEFGEGFCIKVLKTTFKT